ncbi:MAG: hypothetical protein IPG43_04795 [Proteobacteria bacterium]|nr:hypothetical protein [Pseudomonadota bacterium]
MADDWQSQPSTAVRMMPTPLGLQPTAYIRNAWRDQSWGRVEVISVASVHDGTTWALRAEWSGVSAPHSDFPDAFAIALPVRGNPALPLMGAMDAPMHVLRWQSREPTLTSQLTTGIGQSATGPQLACSAHALNAGGRWQLVITRALGADGDIAPLAPGQTTRIGFAIWRGDNEERAGIKAYSIDWIELQLGA